MQQEKPTNSSFLLTRNEVEEANKAVAKVLESTSKKRESIILIHLFREPKLESTQHKMVQQMLQSVFPQNGVAL